MTEPVTAYCVSVTGPRILRSLRSKASRVGGIVITREPRALVVGFNPCEMKGVTVVLTFPVPADSDRKRLLAEWRMDAPPD